ncbi:MAG: IS200/IS605 family transposase [Candidatus Marinimicrobia bacterium]|nr:IS200/IS605 family transposase [Candidatus Neomarinimicrobiota bacterium]MBL7023758.1 IS200/IS605 family transposase [Candidatus Neomarinimicrobiota bacterium]MBL7110019.1 IS200/IS605 family transposase [Candidatus Neomarinimicrobiota bacterium]
MSHSLTKLWIHSIFGTKNREPLISKDISGTVHNHMQEQLEEMGCKVRIIKGTSDHVHQLFLLSNDNSIAQVMKSIKGESSHWINQKNLTKTKFSWQTGYGAFSVSESNVSKVERYIRNQEEHHKNMTFREEYERFMKQHKLEINQ